MGYSVLVLIFLHDAPNMISVAARRNLTCKCCVATLPGPYRVWAPPSASSHPTTAHMQRANSQRGSVGLFQVSRVKAGVIVCTAGLRATVLFFRFYGATKHPKKCIFCYFFSKISVVYQIKKLSDKQFDTKVIV